MPSVSTATNREGLRDRFIFLAKLARLRKLRQLRKKLIKSIWIRDSFENREQFGVFETLCKEQKKNRELFFRFIEGRNFRGLGGLKPPIILMMQRFFYVHYTAFTVEGQRMHQHQ